MGVRPFVKCYSSCLGGVLHPAVFAACSPSLFTHSACLANTQDVIYKEEVSHCAAGVRWLKHLHALARSMGQQAGGNAAAGEASSHRQAQQQLETAAEPQQQGDSEAGAAGEQRLQAWAEEAQKYPTVEEWFHCLVRAHFRGPLKPPL